MKKWVDTFEPGQIIPHCQLYARLQLLDSNQREPLQYTIHLLGAKEPYNVITIHSSLRGTLY